MRSFITTDRKVRRKKRVSMNIFGNHERPRISVFRSNKFIYAQAVDDEQKKTLCSSNSVKTKAATKSEDAYKAGVELGEKLKQLKINKAIFDRGAYTYLGRVQKFADGLRSVGIQI